MSYNISKYLLISSFTFFLFGCSCSGENKGKGKDEKTEVVDEDCMDVEDDETISDPRARVFYNNENVTKDNTFIVISKKNLNLSVYGVENGETILVARYPVCISKNKGQKQMNGDMKTPESEPNEPFTITEMKDASTWCHNFGDGRGDILAYGNWFLRLSYGSGIGIHGSTNNRWSVPGGGEAVPEGKTLGRDSEGCIRLLDEDIIHLHDNYAHLGMKVIIKNEDQGALDFEKKAKKTEGKLLNK